MNNCVACVRLALPQLGIPKRISNLIPVNQFTVFVNLIFDSFIGKFDRDIAEVGQKQREIFGRRC